MLTTNHITLELLYLDSELVTATMHGCTAGNFKFGNLNVACASYVCIPNYYCQICQIAKLKLLPKFPAIRYNLYNGGFKVEFMCVYLESNHEETDYSTALKQQMGIQSIHRVDYEKSLREHYTGASESCDTQKLLISCRKWYRGNVTVLSTQSLRQILESIDEEISYSQSPQKAAALEFNYRSQELAVLQINKSALYQQIHSPSPYIQIYKWVDKMELRVNSTIINCSILYTSLPWFHVLKSKHLESLNTIHIHFDNIISTSMHIIIKLCLLITSLIDNYYSCICTGVSCSPTVFIYFYLYSVW